MARSPSPRTTASKSARNDSGSQVGSGPPATSSLQRPRSRRANHSASSRMVAMQYTPTTSAFAARASVLARRRLRNVQSSRRTSCPASRSAAAT